MTLPSHPQAEEAEMQAEDYRAFGDFLMLYRKHKKVKSSEFAKKHGISRATLWRIEAGKSKDIPISLHNELLSTTRAEGAKQERERWINQPANKHDEEIRQAERERIAKIIRKDRPIFMKNNIVDLIESDQAQRIRTVLRIEILEELGIDCTELRASLTTKGREK